ncbi:RHOMBOID-like protein 5 [Citrus sinensis]|nr:RHOMBOID-like protein 5 [Citrus sinensis]
MSNKSKAPKIAYQPSKTCSLPPKFYPPLPSPSLSSGIVDPAIFLAGRPPWRTSHTLPSSGAHGSRRSSLLFALLWIDYSPLFSSRLRDLGGLDRNLVVRKNQKYRLLSSMWLHAGIIHLVVNMTSLMLVSYRLEQEFGFARIAPLYLLSGFGGSLLSCLHHKGKKEIVSVGASGALFGLLGTMLSELIANWTIYENKCTSLSVLGSVIALNLAFGFIPGVDGVDNLAHIGGFASGVLLGFILFLRPQYGYLLAAEVYLIRMGNGRLRVSVRAILSTTKETGYYEEERHGYQKNIARNRL